MDFKDILQAEIQSKRRRFEEKAGDRNYIRRGDLEEEKEATVFAPKINHDNKKDEKAPQEETVVETFVATECPATEDISSTPKKVRKPSSLEASPTKMPDEILLVGAMETPP